LFDPSSRRADRVHGIQSTRHDPSCPP
jgi:hypothetical protein